MAQDGDVVEALFKGCGKAPAVQVGILAAFFTPTRGVHTRPLARLSEGAACMNALLHGNREFLKPCRADYPSEWARWIMSAERTESAGINPTAVLSSNGMASGTG